jgi:hypothetical protein
MEFSIFSEIFYSTEKARALDHPTLEQIDHSRPGINTYHETTYVNHILSGQIWSSRPAFAVT